MHNVPKRWIDDVTVPVFNPLGPHTSDFYKVIECTNTLFYSNPPTGVYNGRSWHNVM